MNKPYAILATDQYGNRHYLNPKCPRKELLNLVGRKSCQKVYIDTKDGNTKHVGYIVGGGWITLSYLTEWSKKA